MLYDLCAEQAHKCLDGVTFVYSPDIIICSWLGSENQLTNYLKIEKKLPPLKKSLKELVFSKHTLF